MITALQNNKSLTFYQIPATFKTTDYTNVANGMSATALATVVSMTANTTNQFNSQLNNFLNILHAKRDEIARKVADGLANDPNYTGARRNGVNLAWDYEKADVEMGGKGSANWNKAQRQEIIDKGSVRGAEGHHQKNVADHPEDQGDADNIKFYKSRQEHKDKGHNGDFHNSSDAPKIDKDHMLKKTNFKRVVKNELRGCGIAAAIGVGVGFTVGFTVSLAQNGITPDSLKNAMAAGGKAGLSSGAQSVIGYGIGRTIGQLATNALEGVLENIGIEVSENISKMCSMGSIGAITIAVFSTIQLIKLVRSGVAFKEAAIQVGKQALFSLSILALSIAAQGIWGGPAGLIVSISSGIIMISYAITTSVHDRKLLDAIKIYAIEKSEPILLAA